MLKTAEQMFNDAEKWMERIERKMESFNINAPVDTNELNKNIQEINDRHQKIMAEIEEENKKINEQIDKTQKELSALIASNDMEGIKSLLEKSLKETEEAMEKRIGLL